MAAEVPMAGAALLMMWYQAWKQVPCGSMPADDDVIRAKCRIPVSRWEELRPILLRGWWLGEDGRLYHDTVVERVREMLAYRQKEADRRNRNRRGRPDAGGADGGPQDGGSAPPGGPPDTGIVPKLSRGTTGGQGKDGGGTPDTGTGTGTYVSPTLVAKAEKSSTHKSARVSKNRSPETGCEVPSAADVFGARLLSLTLQRVGVQGVGQDDGRLVELARAGVLPDELEAAARAAVKAGAEHPLPWAIARINAQRREAAAVAIAGPPGPSLDPDSREAVEADGVRFGIGRWVQFDAGSGKTTPWPVYKAQVVRLRQADVARGAAP